MIYSSDDEVEYFMQNPKLPIFSHSTKRISAEELISVLLNSPNPQKLCSAQPLSVQENATFLVNCSELESYKDLSSDDNGAWEATGKPCTWFKILFDNKQVSKIHRLEKKPAVKSSKVFSLYRYYSRHASSRDFKRMIATVRGKQIINVTIFIAFYHRP